MSTSASLTVGARSARITGYVLLGLGISIGAAMVGWLGFQTMLVPLVVSLAVLTGVGGLRTT